MLGTLRAHPSPRQSALGPGNREQRDDGRWRSLSGKYSKEGVRCSVDNKNIQAGTIQRFMLETAEEKRNRAPDSNINVKWEETFTDGGQASGGGGNNHKSRCN